MSEGGVGVLVVLLEDTQNFGNVILSTWGQVMNAGRDSSSTLRLEVQNEVAVITNAKYLGPVALNALDQGNTTISTAHEVLRIEFVLVSCSHMLVVQVDAEVTFRGQ